MRTRQWRIFEPSPANARARISLPPGVADGASANPVTVASASTIAVSATGACGGAARQRPERGKLDVAPVRDRIGPLERAEERIVGHAVRSFRRGFGTASRSLPRARETRTAKVAALQPTTRPAWA